MRRGRPRHDDIDDLKLYAVVERQNSPQESWSILLANVTGGNLAVNVGRDGITSLQRGCGPFHPEWLTDQAAPDYLLPPP